jgi:hypothetical protein
MAFAVVGFTLPITGSSADGPIVQLPRRPIALFPSHCSGDTCTGHDPYNQGCQTDAQTAARGDMLAAYGNQVIAIIELKFSAACDAAWAELTAVQPTAILPYPVVNGYVNVDDTTPAVSYSGLPINALSSYTAMVPLHYYTEACVGELGTTGYLQCVRS